MKRITEAAYAKINLCLDIVGRRENGYHELDGVMQSITLCDTLTVSYEEAREIAVSMTAQGNPDMPTDGRNLAVKAAIRFLETVGLGGRVEIELQKRIPMAGGLAGGSTDAAAVLRALNRLTERNLSVGELCAIGAGLGADVPFCTVGGAMRTQGIGDVLTPVPSLPDCHIVIARRGEGVSTPWAYGRLDEIYNGFSKGFTRPDSGFPRLLEALKSGSFDGVCATTYNIFEPIVAECRPDVSTLCSMMTENGASVARMSGSGPSVFGIFLEERDAKKACDALQKAGAEAFCCQPMRKEFF
jgi:4-diphosphocytidyl-2-C-methyl-D-erythritol kinase